MRGYRCTVCSWHNVHGWYNASSYREAQDHRYSTGHRCVYVSLAGADDGDPDVRRSERMRAGLAYRTERFLPDGRTA